ncbi:MAG: NAD-dependent epimerase/dehydratase family protein [Bdellovibrionia bacterium]
MGKSSNTVLVLGGDGYLGWTLAVALATRTDDNIIIVDNLSKRKWEAEVNVQSLVELKSPEERVLDYHRLYKRMNLSYENMDLCNYEAVLDLIKRHKPKTIVNAAQQPSAPFSMMSPKNARTTLDNNSTTNLNVVWAIGSINPDIKHIALGSAGSYLSIDSDFIPKQKVDFEFTYKNVLHKITNSWLPMQASDIYHQSKVNAFLLNDLCTSAWGLKTVTVQQSTLFGHCIPESLDKKYHALSTRFNYDHIFGTVLNRFICQATVRYPITVYGDGLQETGLISLSDAIDNLVAMCEQPLENGVHVVKHSYTHSLSINDMVKHLSAIADIEVKNLVNPRFEPKGTRKKIFEIPTGCVNKMNNEIGFVKDLKALYEFAYLYRDNVNEKYIKPNVNWNHSKGKVNLVSN